MEEGINTQLYGRAKELSVLKAAIARAHEPSTKLQKVFVFGESGAGKSALIRKALHQKNVSLCLGLGKFDERTGTGKPFAPLLSAISEICQSSIRQNGDSVLDRIKEKLQQDDRSTLVSAMPELDNILPQHMGEAHTFLPVSNRSKEGLEMLKTRLRLLLQTLVSEEKPIVLCLDDLQWMGPACLSILRFLLSDKKLTNFLFIGSYRSNEVQPESELSHWLRGLETEMAEENFVQLSIGNLNIEEVTSLLSDITHNEKDRVTEISELILQRTGGNIFHILQLMKYLEQEALLSRSLLSFKWTWDMTKIRSKTHLSDNVLELVSRRIKKLPTTDQSVLKCAALLGYEFTESLLHEVESAIHNSASEGEPASIEDCVVTLIAENMLERVDSSHLKFAHDKIREAGLSLIGSGDDQMQFQYEVGVVLFENLGIGNYLKGERTGGDDDRRLFVCADLLNAGRKHIKDGAFRILVAELNNQASKRAASYSAFVAALEYLRIGLELIDPDECWKINYDLALDLHTSMAEMCYCSGDFSECTTMIEQVRLHSRSVEDCIPADFVLMDCLAAQNLFDDQLSSALEILQKFGENIPQNPTILRSRLALARTRNLLMSTSDEEILKLPMATNVQKASAARVISSVLIPLESLEKWQISALMTCRTVHLTFEYGLTPYSALVFAVAANQLIARRNDVELGCRLARLAIKMSEKSGEPKLAGSVLMHSNFTLHWVTPLSQTVDSWISGYKAGMRTGDVTAAFYNVTGYSMGYFYAGLPLGPLVPDLENFLQLMLDYNRYSVAFGTVPAYQCVLNATGNSDGVMDDSQVTALRKKFNWEARTGEQAEWSFQMQIAFMCEEFDQATSIYNKLKLVYSGISRSLPLFHARIMFFSLICIHNAKRSKQIRFKRQARQYHDTLRVWVVRQKAINVSHKLMIVDAEMMTLKGKDAPRALKDSYDKAITAATRSGFLQDAALAAHLASRAGFDATTQADYFERACDLYSRWGARGIVRHLTRTDVETRRKFLQDTTPVQQEGFRSRQRFDKDSAQQHKTIRMDQNEAA